MHHYYNTAGAFTALIGIIVASYICGTPHAQGAPVESTGQYSALGTAQQIDAERIALGLLADPGIKAAQVDLRNDLQTSSFYKMLGAPERLDDAITQWTLAVILRELAADPAEPRILWEFADTPRSWHGLFFPGGSGLGDNPDHIYRTTIIDGMGRYEITGKVPTRRPVQFSFQAVYGTPGMSLRKSLTPGAADVGNNIKMLTDDDIDISSEGRFRIAVGGEPPKDARNYLPTVQGTMEIQVRDIIQDWNEKPVDLQIRRLDASAASVPLDNAEIARRATTDLRSFVNFWLGATERVFDSLKVNTVSGPIPRDGGWGYIALSHFKFGPGEAAVATLSPQGARYLGVQTNDQWMVVPDGSRHLTSLNLSQTVPNADGSVSFIISAEDPGVANWVDTAGVREGFVVMRWQVVPRGAKIDTKDLVRKYELVSLAAIKSDQRGGGPDISPEKRRAQLARRASDYAKRLSD
jgi:hypothetical protein